MRKTLSILGVIFIAILLLLAACESEPETAPATTPQETPTEKPELTIPTPVTEPEPEITPELAPEPEQSAPESEPPAKEPEPAKFEIISLVINPIEVEVRETAEITAVIQNTGGKEGTYTAILTVNGVEVKTKDIVVAPGVSQGVSFTLSKEEPGTYRIELGSLSSNLRVIHGPAYSSPQTYQVTRTLTIRNETAGIDRIKVWMPMVVEWNSQRNIVIEETTPSPSSMLKDPQYSSGVLFWEFLNKPSIGSSVTITEQFTYTSYAISYEVDPVKIAVYDKDDPEYILFTRSGKYIEANIPKIIETATDIVRNETNPYAAAYSIYEWVINHMTYQLVGGLKGAEFAFENGYGECGDYSALFVALCRAAGIPARPVAGRWATSEESDWHVWAEFYLPGYGWIPVDPTIADETQNLKENFGHLDNKRLIFNKTYNIILHPEPYFFDADVGFLQTLCWEYHGLSGEIKLDLSYSCKQISGS